MAYVVRSKSGILEALTSVPGPLPDRSAPAIGSAGLATESELEWPTVIEITATATATSTTDAAIRSVFRRFTRHRTR